MRKLLLKLSVAATLTLGFAVLNPVAAQAQTAAKGTGTASPAGEVMSKGQVLVGGSGTEEDPYIIANDEATASRAAIYCWWCDDQDLPAPHIWISGNGSFYYLNI